MEQLSKRELLEVGPVMLEWLMECIRDTIGFRVPYEPCAMHLATNTPLSIL